MIDSSAGGACFASETPLNWNQGGPTGPTGPTGGVGPTGPTGQAGPTIFERALGGGDVPNDLGTIESLPLPPGTYLITAKLEVAPSAVGSNTDEWWEVECSLVAGNDADQAAEADDTSDFHFSRFGTMTMLVTHEFVDGGSADVICGDRGDQSGPSDADFFSLVIAAIEAGDVQHP